MIYLLQDDFFGSEQLAALKSQFGDRGLQDLNTTTLDGQKTSLDDLIRACDAIPFLAERRLVIVRRLLGRLEPKQPSSGASRKTHKSELDKQLCDYLERLPSATDLVFVEDRPISEQSSVHKAIRRLGGTIAHTKTLKDAALQDWIQERVKTKEGRISARAISELAAYAGSDLRLLDSEIDKLLAYADGGEIGDQDVRLLVSYASEGTIFNLVDAVGRRDARSALQLLHELLADGLSSQFIIVMITRQFRLLLQARELVERGASPDDVMSRLRVHPFVARKAMDQARNFSAAHLETAYLRLAEIDQAVKTGRMGDETAVHLLVVELGGSGHPGRRGL